MAGMAVLIYLGWRVSLVTALIIATQRSTVQVLTKWLSIRPALRRLGLSRLVNRLEASRRFLRPILWFRLHPESALRLILFRRYLYLAGIVIALVSLLFATSWGPALQIGALVALTVILIILIICKSNRLREDHTGPHP